MHLLLLVLFQSLFASAAPGVVHCESTNVIFSYNFVSANQITDFEFAFKRTPDQKTQIQAPKDQGGGVFDVTVNGIESYIEIPPYAGQADVTQYFVNYQAYFSDHDKSAQDLDEDVFCKN